MATTQFQRPGRRQCARSGRWKGSEADGPQARQLRGPPVLQSGRSRRRPILAQAGEGPPVAGAGRGREWGRTGSPKRYRPFRPASTCTHRAEVGPAKRAGRASCSLTVARKRHRGWSQRQPRWLEGRKGPQRPRGSLSRSAPAFCTPAQSLSGPLILFLAFSAFFLPCATAGPRQRSLVCFATCAGGVRLKA